MKPRHDAAVFANPFLLWSTFGLKMMQMSAAAAQVIALRTTRMATAGPNPGAADRREMQLLFGMAMQVWRTGIELFAASTRLAASRTIPQTVARQQRLADTLVRGAAAAGQGATSAATARLAHRALAPVHRKATANARRLAKKAR